MWPLLILSLLGLILFVERTYFLHRRQIRAEPFIAGIKNLIRKRRLLEALTVCEESPGPVVNVVKAALLNFNQGEEQQRFAIQSAALVQIPILERRIGTLALIAKVSPLIGCLGTVLSLLQGFFRMQSLGPYANAASFSAEVGQALITSAMGLAIAILAYFAYHFLYGRVRAIVRDMEWVGTEIMQFLLRDLPEEEDSDFEVIEEGEEQ